MKKTVLDLYKIKVEAWVDKMGMYRLVSIALIILALFSILLGLLKILPYSASEQIVSLLVVLVTVLAVNFIVAKILHIHVHFESAFITGLIVFFLVLPPLLYDWRELSILALVAAFSILAKFLFVWRKQHVVNPAAMGSVLAVALLALFPSIGSYYPSWWIGTPVLIVPLIIVGSLVVTKTRKWPMVTVFLGVGFLVYAIEAWRSGSAIQELSYYWLSGPSLFLAFFMLTEPFTTPPTRTLQLLYAGIVAVLAQISVFSPLFIMTPEIALVIGNVAFFGTTLRQKLFLPLKSVRVLADRTYEFSFPKPPGVRFLPGQYLEWMLPHAKHDTRGERRYFTIASSPTESVLRLALRVPEKMSSYKKALLSLEPAGVMIASQLAGDFLLPQSLHKKLGFIAGGIGITPFVSHLRYITDKSEKRNTILFYCNTTSAEISYREEFTSIAQKIPLTVVHVLAQEHLAGPEYEHGFITADMIIRRAADYLTRTWYVSGPPGMVNAYSKLLKGMGVKRKNIIEDFFPGLG